MIWYKVFYLQIMKFIGKRKIYFAGLLLLIIAIAFSLIKWQKAEARSGRDFEEIKRRGAIRAVFQYSHMRIRDYKSDISYFQYEVLKNFADKNDLTIEVYVSNDLDFCKNRLSKGEYDMIAHLVPHTTQLDSSFTMLAPLLQSRQMLVQNTTNDVFIKNYFQLENASVYIPLHSPHKMRLEHLSEETAVRINIVERYNETEQQLVKAVAKGKIPFTICLEQMKKKYVKDYPEIDISLPVSFLQDYSWVINSSAPALEKELNDFISDFVESPEYWVLYRKYF